MRYKYGFGKKHGTTEQFYHIVSAISHASFKKEILFRSLSRYCSDFLQSVAHRATPIVQDQKNSSGSLYDILKSVISIEIQKLHIQKPL